MSIAKYVIVFSALLIVLSFATAGARGQEVCTETALAQKPGVLRASKLSGSTAGVTAADLSRSRATMTRIHQMIAAGYRPVGLVGEYGYRFSAGRDANTFGYSLYLLKYNCDRASADRSKFYVGTDTPTVVRIDANVINAFDLSAADTADNSFRGYLLVRSRPQKIDGFYYLGDDPSGGARDGQKERTWLVTYGDELPFSYLSRKEYLLVTRARLEKSIRENDNSSGFYNEYVKRVDEHLRKSEAELGRPAIVNWADEERFTGFLEEGARGAFFAIRHNPNYYRKGLPKSAPQFFTVVFSVYEGDAVPVYPNNVEAIKSALDFNVLRGLLGK